MQAFLGLFAAVQSSYSVETSLSPASEERNSTMDVISEVLKTRKPESCSLNVCVFLIRSQIRDHSWKFFVNFKTPFRNLVKCQFLAALQILYCKPANPVKRGLFEISRKITFRTYHPRVLDRVAKYRSFCYFTKK